MASLDGKIMVVAFEGWNDAGESATQAVRRMIEACDLEPFDEIEPDDYVDFTFARPVIRRIEDGTRVISWPSTIAYAPTRQSGRLAIGAEAGLDISTGAEGDLFALVGAEPSRNWREFSELVIDIARTCEIDTLVLVGAMLADVPHTRATPTSITSESRSLRELLNAQQSDYEGPTGILSVIGMAAEDAGIASVSLWASVPHYVHASHVPPATIALIDRLCELCDITVPLRGLPDEATAWEKGVDELAERDEDMRAYIDHLERQRDAVESPDASGEALAKEFQRFLEQQPPGTEQPKAERLGSSDSSASDATEDTGADDADSTDPPPV